MKQCNELLNKQSDQSQSPSMEWPAAPIAHQTAQMHDIDELHLLQSEQLSDPEFQAYIESLPPDEQNIARYNIAGLSCDGERIRTVQQLAEKTQYVVSELARMAMPKGVRDQQEREAIANAKKANRIMNESAVKTEKERKEEGLRQARAALEEARQAWKNAIVRKRKINIELDEEIARLHKAYSDLR